MSQIIDTKLLLNKYAVVTGCNRGIGGAICQNFLIQGASVIGCSREVNKQLQMEMASFGQNFHNIQLDVQDETSIKEALKAIKDITKEIDILVNNAGIAHGGIFQMTPLADMRRVFEVNVFGAVAVTQAIARLMVRKKSGSIINISSTAAHLPDRGTMTYGASKAALSRITESLAQELGAMGIRANTIAPGVTETDMAKQMDGKAKERLISASALKKIAQPNDIANVALFLASNLSSHMTGQILTVDGGIL